MDEITLINPITCKPDAAALFGKLGLTGEDLAALAEQGFVSAEYRFRGHRRYGPFHKLRWRVAGRQRVRYLGRNPILGERVRLALAAWQAPRRTQRVSAALLHSVRRALRAAKAAAAPQLACEGRYLHGYIARRRRRDDDRGDGVSTIDALGAHETPPT
jgi:hypothetical protein